MQAELDKQTDAQLETIRSSFGKNKDAVVEKLLERVMEVNPAIHRNFHKD